MSYGHKKKHPKTTQPAYRPERPNINMNTLKTLICAVALTAACVSSKADFAMSASGTAEIQTFSIAGSRTATTGTFALNNKFIYNIISNAVANATLWGGTNIATMNLPSDGYITFSPVDTVGTVTGLFYVTNKSGFYYPLNGIDTNGNYYSWIELDSQNDSYGLGTAFFRLGWNYEWVGIAPQTGLASYHLSDRGGTQTLTSTAVLYVHDDPYCYNDADNPDIFFWNYPQQGGGDDLGYRNGIALEIRGILTATFQTTLNTAIFSRLSITGSGNLMYPTPFIYTDTDVNLVKNATVNFAGKPAQIVIIP